MGDGLGTPGAVGLKKNRKIQCKLPTKTKIPSQGNSMAAISKIPPIAFHILGCAKTRIKLLWGQTIIWEKAPSGHWSLPSKAGG